MSSDNKTVVRMRGASAQDVEIGLRSYMQKVYNMMALALVITGATAFILSTNPAVMAALWGSPLKWVAMFAPLALVFFLSFKIDSMQYSTAQMIFLIYSALVGVSISLIFVVYTGESITRVFFITAATFGAMSLYGYTTQRDLSGFGSFLFMGLIGVILASLVNIFLKSSMMQFVISIISVLIFTGLTAYDTQMIKDRYYEAEDGESLSKIALMGALALYLDFLNLFLNLLRLFGDRR